MASITLAEKKYFGRLATLVLVGLLLLTTTINSRSAEPASVIAGSTLISGLIADLEESSRVLMEQLDNRVSARAFQFRSELVFLQDELALSAKETLGMTFEGLSDQQRLFFTSADRRIKQIEEMLVTGTDALDDLASTGESVVAQFPFTKETPRVRKSSPLYLASGSQKDKVRVLVGGSFLNHGTAELLVNNTQCDLYGQTQTEVSFSCDARLFKTSDGDIRHITGMLRVSDEQSFFDWLSNLFTSETASRYFRIPFNVVPETMGKFPLEYTVRENAEEYADRDGTWGRTNDHCKGRQDFHYNFGPSGPGWEIDVQSVRTSVGCNRRGGHAVRNLSVAGFQIHSWSSNSGRCEKILGSVVAKDGRGCHSGSVSWRERRIIEDTSTTTAAEGELSWGQDQVFQIPENFVSFTLSVEQIDGTTTIRNEASAAPWFDITRDAHSTSLVISPVSLEKALR